MSKMPFIACLCCTYKRTRCLQNAVACFLAQDYPPDRRAMFILDDAGQHHSQLVGPHRNVHLDCCGQRFKSLSQKHNALAESAARISPHVYAVWDDDDVYLPNHFSSVAAAYSQGGEFFPHRVVMTTYGHGDDGLVTYESAEYRSGEWELRFHSSWAFTRHLFEIVGGYPPSRFVGEYDHHETDLGRRLKAAGRVEYVRDDGSRPERQGSYVCRVFNQAEYNLTKTDGGTYQDNWERIGRLPAPFVGDLVPRFDDWTRKLYRNLAGVDV